MTDDPEAAWPLTDTESGYYPSSAPSTPPPSNLKRFVPPPAPQRHRDSPNNNGNRAMPHGIRIAYLAIILGAAIPLTAIAGSYSSQLVIVTWVGIIMVAAIAFGASRR